MKKRIAILFFMLISSVYSFSQCAMCRAVVESGDDGAPNRIGEQLNIGILFLMAIPYIFIVLIPIILFRKKIKKFFKDFGSIYDDN
ncbi:MAG: hypothetical protein ACOZCO_01045 [Bacteroidota bacterium]